jgi:hypothetical protein
VINGSENITTSYNGHIWSVPSTKCDGVEPGTKTYELAKKYEYYNHAFADAAAVTNYITYYTHKIYNKIKSTDAERAEQFKTETANFGQFLVENFDNLRVYINDTWDVNGLVFFVIENGNNGTFYYIAEGLK